MATGTKPRRSPRRRAAREPGLDGAPQDGLTWPQLAATWTGRSPRGLAAAHNRAAQLLAGGWGSIPPDAWGGVALVPA